MHYNGLGLDFYFKLNDDTDIVTRYTSMTLSISVLNWDQYFLLINVFRYTCNIDVFMYLF